MKHLMQLGGLTFLLSMNAYARPFYDQTLKTSKKKAIERLCTNSELSFTCGDFICDKNENHLNCPSDCSSNNEDFKFEDMKSGSYNARTWCPDIKEVLDPTNISEVQAAVTRARKAGLRIKPIGASHTDNEAICTDGVIITSRKLTSIYGMESFEGVETVHAQAGVTVGDLGAWLHNVHKGLGYGIVGFEKVRIGGVVGTGAHGSSIPHKDGTNRSSLLSDRVVSMRMVMADGSIQEFSRGTTGQTDPDLWNALRLHLGLFGFIHDMRIEIEDEFQIEAFTKAYSDKGLFKDNGVWDYVKDCDVAHVNWFPQRFNKHTRSNGRVIVHCGKATHKEPNDMWHDFEKEVDKDAQYTLHNPHANPLFFRILKHEIHSAVCSEGAARFLETVRRHDIVSSPPFEKRSGLLNHLGPDRKGVRGWSHVMQNSHGSPQGNTFRQTDWEVAIPMSRAVEAFHLLKEIFADTKTKKGYALPLIGLYMRFGVVNDTLLSHAAQGGDFKLGEPVIFIEIPEFLPSFDIKTEEDLVLIAGLMEDYEAPLRRFVSTLVEKIGGRVHWAKNRKELFNASLKDEVRASQIRHFRTQVLKLDPEGVFSNEFSEILGLSSPKHNSPKQSSPKQEL